jgi:hypothetical protein
VLVVVDYVIADGGPNGIFRIDNLVLDFKDLSIIQLSVNADLTRVLKLD